jgi:hypothetical protein
VHHFEDLFKELDNANIEEILEIVSYFLGLVGEEENERMYREVTREEIIYVLISFMKYRGPCPEEWTMELYIEFFDMLGEDIIRVVEAVRTYGRFLISFLLLSSQKWIFLRFFMALDLSPYGTTFTSSLQLD